MGRKTVKQLEKEISELKDEISNLKSEVISLQKRIIDRPNIFPTQPSEPFESPWISPLPETPIQPLIPGPTNPSPFIKFPWLPDKEPFKVICTIPSNEIKNTLITN